MSRVMLVDKTKVNFVAPDKIVFLKASGSYCIIKLTDGSELKVARNLKYVSNLLKDFRYMVKVHRSYIVNCNYIENICNLMSETNIAKKTTICLEGGHKIPFSKSLKATIGYFYDKCFKLQ